MMVEAEKAAGFGSRTILFVDEIHRFNKAQQDAFLPYVERGTIRLIGATTENPSFEIICRAALALPRLHAAAADRGADRRAAASVRWPIRNAASGLRESGRGRRCPDDDCLLRQRRCAQRAERSGCRGNSWPRGAAASIITKALAAEAMQRRVLLYDKKGEQHYDIISALHKSVRNSDPDAALYWLSRMLEAGEDPMYCARRIVRMAVEDIGLAAPEALNLCLSAKDAMSTSSGIPRESLRWRRPWFIWRSLRSPTRFIRPMARCRRRLERRPPDPVPLHLRNAPTQADEGAGLRAGLPVRARSRRPRGGHGVPATFAGQPPVLPAHERRPRETAGSAHG